MTHQMTSTVHKRRYESAIQSPSASIQKFPSPSGSNYGTLSAETPNKQASIRSSKSITDDEDMAQTPDSRKRFSNKLNSVTRRLNNTKESNCIGYQEHLLPVKRSKLTEASGISSSKPHKQVSVVGSIKAQQRENNVPRLSQNVDQVKMHSSESQHRSTSSKTEMIRKTLVKKDKAKIMAEKRKQIIEKVAANLHNNKTITSAKTVGEVVQSLSFQASEGISNPKLKEAMKKRVLNALGLDSSELLEDVANTKFTYKHKEKRYYYYSLLDRNYKTYEIIKIPPPSKVVERRSGPPFDCSDIRNRNSLIPMNVSHVTSVGHDTPVRVNLTASTSRVSKTQLRIANTGVQTSPPPPSSPADTARVVRVKKARVPKQGVIPHADTIKKELKILIPFILEEDNIMKQKNGAEKICHVSAALHQQAKVMLLFILMMRRQGYKYQAIFEKRDVGVMDDLHFEFTRPGKDETMKLFIQVKHGSRKPPESIKLSKMFEQVKTAVKKNYDQLHQLQYIKSFFKYPELQDTNSKLIIYTNRSFESNVREMNKKVVPNFIESDELQEFSLKAYKFDAKSVDWRQNLKKIGISKENPKIYNKAQEYLKRVLFVVDQPNYPAQNSHARSRQDLNQDLE